MPAKRAVGLLVYVRLPMDQKIRAILQLRGEFNFSKWKPHSWPGACQVTCHGKCRNDEDYEDALKREAFEELGKEAARTIYNKFSAMHTLVAETQELNVRTYGLFLSGQEAVNFIRSIRLHPSTGGLRLVTADCRIYDINSYGDDEQIEQNVTALFRDEQVALRRGFELFL